VVSRRVFHSHRQFTGIGVQGGTGEAALLNRLQQLSGFDNAAFIRAMACASNAQFVGWKCA
jgi:hypothetical protein